MMPIADRSFRPTKIGFLTASVTLSLAAASLLGERDAAAQTRFGDKGQLAITAENLFSFTADRVAESRPGGDVSVNSSRFGFLMSGQRATNPGAGDRLISPLGPQIGGHYFIIPSLSIGGTIGYEARGGSITANVTNGATTTTVTTNADDESTFVFLPKAGYALMLNNTIGFWFRAGIGFGRVGTSGPGNPTKVSNTFWLLSGDALFVVSPFPHFGFFVGPEGNISFAGSHSQTANNGIETSWSASFRSLAIGAGMLGYIDL